MALQIIREVNADVFKRGATKAVYAKQNDINSRFLNIRIQEEGKDIKVASTSQVWLNVERPDKQENIFYGTVNADGTVQVPLTGWMLELEGTLVCDVSIIDEDPTVAKLTTMQFNIYVEAAVVSNGSFEESEEYSIIIDLLNRTEEAERKISEAEQKASNAAADAEAVRDACVVATENANTARKACEDVTEGAEAALARKQNKLAWVTEADLDKMIAGTYVGVEDEEPAEIVGSTITMQDGASGLYYSIFVDNGELKMEVG